jgi:hypothetical protein
VVEGGLPETIGRDDASVIKMREHRPKPNLRVFLRVYHGRFFTFFAAWREDFLFQVKPREVFETSQSFSKINEYFMAYSLRKSYNQSIGLSCGWGQACLRVPFLGWEPVLEN